MDRLDVEHCVALIVSRNQHRRRDVSEGVKPEDIVERPKQRGNRMREAI
jgi:hypothetical protein